MNNITATSYQVLESVIIEGNIEKLPVPERIEYYMKVCESLKLNPLTRPFDYLKLNGKITLYAKKECTEQLRRIYGISIEIKARELVEGCYIVTVQARDHHGRVDEAIGAVPIEGLKGEARSNAMMKAETKAKRRATLSISGLGMTDESEVCSIPGAVTIEADKMHEDRPSLQGIIKPDTLDELESYVTKYNVPASTAQRWTDANKVDSIDQLPEIYAQRILKKYRSMEPHA